MSFGCWCGLGPGFAVDYTPVNAFDSFCRVHDYCYRNSFNSPPCNKDLPTGWLQNYRRAPYTESYNWYFDKNGTKVILKLNWALTASIFALIPKY